ncbi:MBL fold metallo-hydrolase [Sphingomonas prati]|uniref:Ribonuclease J n=1 Tax=Sphingomonas prati TaxID=1843237 RepID=A0A7W9BUZ6_9SPHN|nr:MBL fold metallo-hydrolase [Sphingomonas prati]MBB5730605.1 ribonuclease J [Sphingomonas prati]GGE95307.1 MBL fold hydrolase [Sphingomonas prati]
MSTAPAVSAETARHDVKLTVHRSTDQIGGNCIEICAGDHRLILDVGRPLDAPGDATGLLPQTMDLESPASVLISHPHQDHYGLLEEIPDHWAVYSGDATEKLIRLTASITGKTLDRSFRHWRSGEPLAIGPFIITPFLTDHSAFDAFMLLIDVAGRRILYSGDFRAHGRKSALVERFIANPPPGIDVLLMEGTNLGSDKSTTSESELEDAFVPFFRETPGRVFVAWSAQNVDRTVTLYRAAKRADRTLVVDLYTAEVLELLADHGRLPRAGMENVKVVITSAMARMYKRKGMSGFVDRMATGGRGISARALNGTTDRWVIMLRESLMRDYARSGVVPTSDDAWCWSMWKGYLGSLGAPLVDWLAAARPVHLHTSGHASPADLRRFAEAMQATRLVPIHSFTWDSDGSDFPAMCRLRDGEPLLLQGERGEARSVTP